MTTLLAISDHIPSFQSDRAEEATLQFLTQYQMLSASMFCTTKADPSTWRCNNGIKFQIPISYNSVPTPHYSVHGKYYCGINPNEIRVITIEEKFFINNSLAYITASAHSEYSLIIEQYSVHKTVKISLKHGVNIIGRQYNPEISDPEISRLHAKITITIADGIIIENLSKSGGVFTLIQEPQTFKNAYLTFRVYSNLYIKLQPIEATCSDDLNMLNTILACNLQKDCDAPNYDKDKNLVLPAVKLTDSFKESINF